MYELDAVTTRWINGMSGGGGVIDLVMVWVSAIGVPVLVLAVVCQWWLGPDRRRTRYAAVVAGLSFLLGLAINQVILLVVDRTRPYAAGVSDLLTVPSIDLSFPSDHATAAVAIAAAFLVLGLRRRGIGSLLAAVLVAVSRVYVGARYVGDVLGSAVTGALAAVIVPSFYGRDTRLDRFITGIL